MNPSLPAVERPPHGDDRHPLPAFPPGPLVDPLLDVDRPDAIDGEVTRGVCNERLEVAAIPYAGSRRPVVLAPVEE